MWIDISDWGLRQLARALHFHQQVVHMPPAQLVATGNVQAMKRGAFYFHVMEHEVQKPEYAGVLQILQYLTMSSCCCC